MDDIYVRLIENILLEGPKFIWAYYMVVAAVVINSVYIWIASKKYKTLTTGFVLFGNGLLTLSLIFFCMFEVLMVDAFGKTLYDATSKQVNTFLYLFFVCAFLCLIDFIVIIFYKIKGKKHKDISSST